jgi:hypothetical protein
MQELIRKSDGFIPFTLGNFHETETEYIVYDGADYIGFNKEEYSLVDIKETIWN